MPTGNQDYAYQLFRKIGLSDFGARTAQLLVQRPLEILLVVVIAMMVTRVGSRVVQRSVYGLVSRSTRKMEGVADKLDGRAETLAGVASNLLKVAVWAVASLMVLDKVGINPGPLLAGASILGVAVGFGAQSLVRDFLSGFFVIAEDQFALGDTVTVADISGTVEEMNLRVTRLRAADGTVWFVPNGEIRKVGNSAKDWAVAIVDVSVPAKADLGATLAAINEVATAFAAEEAWGGVVLQPPDVGVESIGGDAFTLRVTAKTLPAERARVTLELRARIGTRLRGEGVLPPVESGA